MGSGHRMPIAVPPIDPAEQFFCAKSEPSKLVRTRGECSAFYPLALHDIDLAAVEPCSGFRAHLAMWEADSPGDVASGICIAGAGVDHDDAGKSGFEINGQIP